MKSGKAKKILLVDGHSMAFRAFYALPVENFQNAAGQHTNAIYGFLNILLKLVETEQLDYLGVAFDISRKSFRSRIYPEYKEGRKPTPVEFKGQIDLIKQVLTALGITWLEQTDYEADDILATWASQAEAAGMTVLVNSGDRDLIQLVSEKVTLLYPGQRATELKRFTPQSVVEKYGISPELYPHIAAIIGEKADNLPGVPGVGEKTAVQWIKKYGNLEELIAHADEIGGKRGDDFRTCLELVKRNRQLNQLIRDMELPVAATELHFGAVKNTELKNLFDELDFNQGIRRKIITNQAFSIRQELLDGTADEVENIRIELPKIQMRSFETSVELGQWLAEKSHQSRQKESGQAQTLVLIGEGNPAGGHGKIYELCVNYGDEAVLIDFTELDQNGLEIVKDFLRQPGVYSAESFKPLWHCLRGIGVDLPDPENDIELLAYLVDPNNSGKSIAELVALYLPGYQREEGAEVDNVGLMDLISTQRGIALAEKAQLVGALGKALKKELEKTGQIALYSQLELPLQRILAVMEEIGIAVDIGRQKDLFREFAKATESARYTACSLVGQPDLNLNSPKQLQEVLFEQLGMPKTKKTKRGYTTNSAALEWLYENTAHPFLAEILKHRDSIKMMQIVEGLNKATDENRRIHTTFKQNVTATGRLSSIEPNLQNIPSRSPSGLAIREVFVAGAGYDNLMSVDYSQIEMRIMAHLSEDEALIEAINAGEDLHRSMASMVFGIPLEEVSSTDRSRVKATSYGLAYRLSAFGLSQQLNMSVSEAKKLMDKYFQRFGKVRDFLDEIVAQARERGYTETIFGRRRYLPELRYGTAQQQQAAERAALNAPIQGSAADLMKRAMVAVDQGLCEQGLKSRVLLQIHDELLLEIKDEEQEKVASLVGQTMSEVANLLVPLTVSIGVGKNWREAAH